MQNDLDKIVKGRNENLKNLFSKEDKSDKMHDDNMDSSQAKENFYKEEFLKQLKLLDANA